MGTKEGSKPFRRALRTAFGGAVALLLLGCQAGAPQAAITPPAGAVELIADGFAFSPSSLQVPAGRPLVIFFENRERPPHNVHLQDASGATVVKGEVFGGNGARVQAVGPLAAGTYTFVCDVHPSMKGVLTAVP